MQPYEPLIEDNPQAGRYSEKFLHMLLKKCVDNNFLPENYF